MNRSSKVGRPSLLSPPEAEARQAELEKAYDELQAEMEEASAKLEEARNAPGVSYGTLWMMERVRIGFLISGTVRG